MNCPVCGERLREIERSGVMIDICPSCKGIWLDRGEIEKILATEGAQPRSAAPAAREEDRYQREADREYRNDRHEDRDDHDRRQSAWGGESSKGKRRGSFLEDILGGFGGD